MKLGNFILVAVMVLACGAHTVAPAFAADARQPETRAGKGGSTEEMRAAGDNYYYGKGGAEQDFTQAAEWYARAAAKGDAQAMFMLGFMHLNEEGVLYDVKKAMDLYTRASAKGHAGAAHGLGLLYYGSFTHSIPPKDGCEAIKWHKLAAQRGFVDAMKSLAVLYEDELACGKPNLEEARKWALLAAQAGDAEAARQTARLQDRLKSGGMSDQMLEVKRRAEAGDVGAMYKLGEFYFSPLYKKDAKFKDTAAGLRWLAKAADGGSQAAARKLYKIYTGAGEENKPFVNADKAFTWCLKAARLGDYEAKVLVGDMYRLGKGTAVNKAEAIRWYEECAVLKDNVYVGWPAISKLIEIYRDGEGVPRDLCKVYQLYESLAEGGSNSALYSIGKMHEWGFCVRQNDQEAMKWYKKSAEKGDMDGKNAVARLERGLARSPFNDPETAELEKKYLESMKRLSGLLEQMRPQKGEERTQQPSSGGSSPGGSSSGSASPGGNQRPASALQLMEQQARSGDVQAMRGLGEYYYGVRDSCKAFDWYKQAAQKGDGESMFLTGLMYYDGECVQHDMKQTVYWFGKAKDKGHQGATDALIIISQN